MTTEGLDKFITALADHLAHTTELPPDQAQLLIADLVARSRQEYLDAGAMYGDDPMGFLHWLSERWPITPAEP